jgi:transcriptional regulator with XRE-family HTH domain
MTAIEPMTFADRIRDLRTATKRTQSEMAKLAGVPLSTYRSWEQGQRLPSFPAVVRLAKALGVSLDVFAECEDFHRDAET